MGVMRDKNVLDDIFKVGSSMEDQVRSKIGTSVEELSSLCARLKGDLVQCNISRRVLNARFAKIDKEEIEVIMRFRGTSLL